MKLFSTLLVGVAALFGHVAANGASMGFELVQFYYVYKMEYLSNIPAAERRLAVQCSKKFGRMCFFDEFVLSVLEDGPLKTHFETGQGSLTHTLTPGNAEASAISNNANNDDRAVANRLSSTFPSDRVGVPYAEVLQDMTDTAQKAGDAGGAAKADVDGALLYAKNARKVRADDAFLFVRNTISQALGSVATSKYFSVDTHGKTFNWKVTFDNINAAGLSGAINSNQANTFKKVIRDASRGILTKTSSSNIIHWALVKSFATFISKVEVISKSLASGKTPVPAGGGAACSSEFSAGAGAAPKHRRRITERAIVSARQAAQLGPRLSFADGAMPVIDGVAAY